MTSRRSGAKRPAFTLTEILVVIAIIGVLAALLATFVFSAGNRQRGSNTQQTIETVNKVLQAHWAYVIAEARKDPIPTGPGSVTAFADTDKNGNSGADPNGERARVLWIKLRLREAFPIGFSEILTPSILITQRRYNVTYKQVLSTCNSTNHTADTESSACLLMALSVNRGGKMLSPDLLGPALADTDNDGLKEIVDGYVQPPGLSTTDYPSDPLGPNTAHPGSPQPLQFFRFAWTANAGMNPPPLITNPAKGTSTRYNDPLDPTGTLVNPQWYSNATTSSCQTMQTALGYAFAIPPTTTAPFTATYAIPVIVSAGSDGALGFKQDSTTATLGQFIGLNPGSVDNYYSYVLGVQ